MTLTHGELFAGISGFGLGFERAGIKTLWAVEIDPSAQRVLRHHHPDALLFEDVRDVGSHNLPPVDIITFGSPCQDLSVAGRRKGFDGERSGLYFEAIRIIAELRPALAVWENVPGAFSSHGGRDFGAALDALADIGALDIAWRVLDAQWFGVAQRRRRVFVVADFRGERAGEILFEPDGGTRHPPARRTQGQDVAGTLGVSAQGGFGHELDGSGAFVPLLEVGARTNGDGDRDGDGIGDPGDPMYTLQAGKQHGVAMAVRTANTNANGHGVAEDVAHTLDGVQGQAVMSFDLRQITSKDNRSTVAPGRPAPTLNADSGMHVAHTLRAEGHDASEDGTGRGTPLVPLVMSAVTSKWSKGSGWPSGDEAQNLVAFNWQNGGNEGYAFTEEATGPLDTSQTKAVFGHQMAVRRLTPRECERLQGFPDDWTLVDGMSDSARYRMLGNAVAVPVAAWLGNRIVEATR